MENDFEKKSKKSKKSSNLVSIRVWYHRKFISSGHLSIETAKKYVSFVADTEFYLNQYIERQHNPMMDAPNSNHNLWIHKHLSLQQDIEQFGQPDEVIVLNELDVDMIEKMINEIPERFKTNDIIYFREETPENISSINDSAERGSLLKEAHQLPSYEPSPNQAFQSKGLGLLSMIRGFRREGALHEYSNIFQESYDSLSAQQKKMLHSISTSSNIVSNQNLTVNFLVMFILWRAGLANLLKIKNLTRSVLDADLENGIDYHRKENYCCWFSVYDFRSLGFSSFIVESILLTNYFLNVEKLNMGALLGLVPLTCVIGCFYKCFSGTTNLTYTQHDISFKNLIYCFHYAKNVENGISKQLHINLDDSQEAPVTIRIWLPQNKDDVGHVSLETQQIYASLWPDTSQKSSVFSTRSKLQSYQEDCIAERRAPEYTQTLYGLDVEKINDIFSLFQASHYQWSLFGSSLLKSKKMQNCVGLVWALLRVGGIDTELPEASQLPTFDTLLWSTVTTFSTVLFSFLYFPFWDLFKHLDDDKQLALFFSSILFLFCLCYPGKKMTEGVFSTCKGSGFAYTPGGLKELIEKVKDQYCLKKEEIPNRDTDFQTANEHLLTV